MKTLLQSIFSPHPRIFSRSQWELWVLLGRELPWDVDRAVTSAVLYAVTLTVASDVAKVAVCAFERSRPAFGCCTACTVAFEVACMQARCQVSSRNRQKLNLTPSTLDSTGLEVEPSAECKVFKFERPAKICRKQGLVCQRRTLPF